MLATPDDEGHAKGKSDAKAFRVRQNVVLELGMLLARLGRSHVAILLKQQCEMERGRPTSRGLIYIPFNDNVAEAGETLMREMAQQGIRIDLAR